MVVCRIIQFIYMIGQNETNDLQRSNNQKKRKSTFCGWGWCKRSSESSQDVKEYEIKRGQLASVQTDLQSHVCCTCKHHQAQENGQDYLYAQSRSNQNNIIQLTSPTPLVQYHQRVSAPVINYQGQAPGGQRQRQILNNNSQTVRYNYAQNDNRVEVNRTGTPYFQSANVTQTKIGASPQIVQRSIAVQQLPLQTAPQPIQLIAQPQPQLQIQKIPQPEVIPSIPQTTVIQSIPQPPATQNIAQQNLQIVQQTPLIVVPPNQAISNVSTPIIPQELIAQSQPQRSPTQSQHQAQFIQANQPGQEQLQNIPQETIYQEEINQQYEGIPPQQYPPQQYPPQQYPPQQYPPQQYPPQQYPPQQYPDQQYPDQQYPDQQYPGQQYPPQQYPPQYYAQQGDQQQYPPQYYEQNPQQMSPQSSLWQDRFFFLYEKFEIFYQKYDNVTKETGFLAEQFLHVDNEEEWLALKEKYDLLVERMNQMRQENALILQEMQENVQQNQKIQNSQAIKEEAGRVWQHRYHELLEQYESLSHHYAELQSNTNPQENVDDNERMAMMNQKYAQLEAEYNNVVEQLQNSSNTIQSRQEHEDLLKYTQQLQGYIQQLQAQNNTLMKGMKNSVQGSKLIDQAEVGQKIVQKDTEIQNLSQMIVTLEDKLKTANEARPKSNLTKDVQTSQFENQIHQMTLYCGQLEQKLSLKEYEINGMRDKIAYLKEQLQLKNEQIANNSKMVHQKLLKIQSDLSQKNINDSIPPPSPPPPAPVTVRVMAPIPAPSSASEYRLDEDYENRLQEYQRTIASKNNQIRNLQERITESETDLRKANLQKNGFMRDWQQKITDLEDEFRNKLAEKDSKIRDLQQHIQDLQNENQKKVQQKDVTVRNWQLEVTKIKEEVDLKFLEKDIIIKSLKDSAVRMENQIKQRNIQLSHVRSPSLKTPNMRSINQSFAIENARFDDGGKMLSDQLEKKNQEISKLKKERDTKSKQYKSLEQEYSTLQEENNKRRIEVNNLKRQISNLQNLTYEIDSLKSNISKRNQQILELKNGLTQSDKLRMDIDSKQREIDKLSEISRFKTKDIDQLTERNYQLEQKLRVKDFTISSGKTIEYQTQQNSYSHEELLSLKDDVRKKQIELSKYKIQNEQISKKLKRESEELQNLKAKYPAKIKQIEDECNDVKLTLASTQKKYSIVQTKYRQLEETNKKIKTNMNEQFSEENIKLKEYYVKFIEKLEEEIKLSKDKNRKYELQLQDYEQEMDNLTNTNRETETSKSQLQRRLKNISDKLDEKESEMRILKGKENGQINILRKKQARFIEVQAEVKSKDQQVRELEKKVEVLKTNLKVLKNQYEDYKNSMIERMEASNNREMENISQQIVDYESRMVFQNHNFDFKLKDKRSNQVFERRVIYELKQEIQRLQKELDGKGINISLEKMKITAMQQQALMKSKHMMKKDDQSNSEEIRFYKEKNKELEERVNSHIAVNKNLRERLEYVLEQNSKYEDVDKLKIRITELQAKINEYEQKITKLQDQNKTIRKEFNSLEVSSSVSQEFQVQIQESNRRINQVTLERNALQQELSLVRVERDNLEQKCRQLEKHITKLTNQNIVYQSQLQRMKSISRQKDNSPSIQNEDLRRKVDELSRELNNKEVAIKIQTQKMQYISAQCQSLQVYIQKIETELRQFKSKSGSPGLQTEEIDRLKKTLSERQNAITEMRKRIGQLQNECQYYKSQNGGGVSGDAFYYVELIRNNYVELESLASEIGLENERLVLLAERVAQNCQRGLQSCQYLHEVLSC